MSRVQRQARRQDVALQQRCSQVHVRLPEPSVGGAQVGDDEEGHEDGDVAVADAAFECEVHGDVAEEVVDAPPRNNNKYIT